jgi:Tfp pilus assembly protein PilO
MNRPITQREKIIFVFCLFIVSFYAIYHFIIKRFYEEEQIWQMKRLGLERQIAKKVHVLKDEEILNDHYNRYVASLEQEGTENQQMSLILSEIESIAGQVDLKIGDMKPQKVRSQDFYNYFSVNIRVQGEMNLLARFLYMLQTTPHLFHIDELRLEKRSVRSSEIECNLVVSRLRVNSSL